MSAYIFENGEFAPFYGIAIISTIKNQDDFKPLMSVLKPEKNIVLVDNLNLKIYDIFSQTLYSLIGDSCKAIDDWFNENGGLCKPYQYLQYDTILSKHYEAKEFLKSFPPDFEISKKTQIKIKNNKIILHFRFSKEHHRDFLKETNKKLNLIYGAKRKFSRSIVIGYLKNSNFNFSEEKLKTLNSLIPKKIFINSPDVYQYKNVNEFVHYSHGMY